MKGPIVLLPLLFFLASPGYGQRIDSGGLERYAIEFSEEWIQKVRSHDPSTDSAAPLVKVFERRISPDTLALPSSKTYRDRSFYFLNPLSADLDADPEGELLALIGKSRWDPMLAVFDKKKEAWELVGKRSFHVYYEKPQLRVLNVPSSNKTFCIRWLYGRGTGYLHVTSHFFKLWAGKLVHALATVADAHSSSFKPGSMDKEVRSSISFDGSEKDVIRVRIRYDYVMNAGEKGRIKILSGNESFRFEWEAEKERYQKLFPTDASPLKDRKFERLQSPYVQDSLFIRAFHQELRKVMKEGQGEKKKALRRYLRERGTPKAGELLETE